MQRLDFVLPDFTRISWTGDTARDCWEKRIARIGSAWPEIEWRSVQAGVRRCAINVVSAETLISRSGIWADSGLNMLPVELQRLTPYSYSSTSSSPGAGEPCGFRVVVGAPADLAAFRAAWNAADQNGIGELLGYPACCREFFRACWVEQDLVDTSWPMAVRTAGGETSDRILEVTGPPEANILWRWMGVRTVPHLPCSFGCAATVDLGRKFIQTGREAGFGEEMDWLLEILSWNVQWSALHGIAEVKTPILKVSTRTDATPVNYVVNFRGTDYPAEGARGLSFPYQTRGAGDRLDAIKALGQRYASDNGFSSVRDMDVLHGPVVDLAVRTLGSTGGNVVDLGCGNGALLRKILASVPGLHVFGIDSDRARIDRARELIPQFRSNFIAGDMFESADLWPEGRRYSLALLMPGRFRETSAEKAARLLDRLRRNCDRILVYAYGDQTARQADLRALAEEAGLDCVDFHEKSAAGLARVR